MCAFSRAKIDRILSQRKDRDAAWVLVKWQGLSYDQCTWEIKNKVAAMEHFQTEYDLWEARSRLNDSQLRFVVHCAALSSQLGWRDTRTPFIVELQFYQGLFIASTSECMEIT